MFGIFKRKPKRCQNCGCEQQKLHAVYSAYYKDKTDETPQEVCTPCLSRLLPDSLQSFSSRAVFVEPLSEDGYVFVRFADEQDKANLAQPLESFLAPQGTACSVCAKATRYCWLPLEVTVDNAEALQYQNKSTFTDYQYLCVDHLSTQFIECVEKNHFYFLTLRLPVGDAEGFCY